MFDSVFTRHWFDREVVAIWSERSTIQSWFDVETALASAQADLGMIPAESAAAIAACASAEKVDLERMARDIAFMLHPFVPALRQLEEFCGKHAAFLHWGATTQNIFDTATALLLKRTHSTLLARLSDLLATMSELAARTRQTVVAGRTHGQHALPISFGFKIAGWMGEFRRHGERLRALERRVFVARLGGAVGTFAAMDGNGRAVQAAVARKLSLYDGEIPSRSAVDHFGEYVTVLGLLAATVEKVASNLIFLQRTEIAEVAEAFHDGKIGSSTMPQKRNPARLMNIVGLARLMRLRVTGALDAMVQTDEADGAATNLCDTVIREAAVIATSAVAALLEVFGTLHIDDRAMRHNLGKSRGLIMAESVMMRLAPEIGRHRAHELIYETAMEAFSTGRTLAEVLAVHPELVALTSKVGIGSLLDPAGYLGEALDCVDDERARALAWRSTVC